MLMLSFCFQDSSVSKCNNTNNNVLLEKIDERIVQLKLFRQQLAPLLMKWLQISCLPSFSAEITIDNKQATAISTHSHCHSLYRSFSSISKFIDNDTVAIHLSSDWLKIT